MDATVMRTSVMGRPWTGEVSFWDAMGLLDDAIRQHLEFKRLRGANPSEIAREERDALGYGYHDQDTAPPARLGAPGDSSGYTGDDLLDDLEPAPRPGLHIDQETAELDMRTVLEVESVELAVHRVPTSTGAIGRS
jgi:hypothetical protein